MRISIISDVVCPWCRIGKANLMKAADQWTSDTGETVEVQMLPFLLDPVEPGVKEDFRERFVNRKGMPEEQMRAMFDRVTQVGAQQGIHFDFDKVKIAVDTVPAHELMGLVPVEKRNDLMDAMMTAYFERGEDVGEPDVLLNIAKQVGLSDDEIAAIEPDLRSRKLERDVRGMILQAQQSGVRGVPFFIIDDVLAVSGAQPVDVFLQAFRQAKETKATRE
ncbi:MAG TPA: DsbA family oxidoreductase [Thermomicrobiales bacterium]|nr:DsbA family oxidoreductase [Thermomicrobiales bacterium]